MADGLPDFFTCGIIATPPSGLKPLNVQYTDDSEGTTVIESTGAAPDLLIASGSGNTITNID